MEVSGTKWNIRFVSIDVGLGNEVAFPSLPEFVV